MTDRRPWLKWYPADWRAEPTLRMCSRAARSLWVDMLGLMHDGEPYGHLTVAGIVPTPQQLARLLGDGERELTRLLAELEAAGVFSRDDAGRIFCRRMLRDKARDDRDRANGKGGGNPRLKGSGNESDNHGVNPPDKAQKPEARSQKPERTSPPPSGSAPSEAGQGGDLSKNGGNQPNGTGLVAQGLRGEGAGRAAPARSAPPESPENSPPVGGVAAPAATLAADPGLAPAAPAPPKRGTRLPADWTLSPDLRAWAIAEGLPDPDREAAKFRDFWHAKAGKDATKTDWPATWRNWVRRAIDGGSNGRGGQRQQQRVNPILGAYLDGQGDDRGA